MTIKSFLAASVAAVSVSLAQASPSPAVAAGAMEQAFARPAGEARPLVF